MSDSGRPFDFGQYSGTGSPNLSPTPLGSPEPIGRTGPAGNFGADTGGEGVTGFSSGFDSPPAPALSPTSAPIMWLYGAMAAALLALATALVLGASPAPAIIAWLLAGPVAIALVAAFSLRDTKARTAPFYSSSDFVTWLYRGVVALSLVAVIVSALRIADWVGRM